jgi:MFS family permease
VHAVKRKENSDVVLIPQPTNDPNDPLNWPAWKKAMAFISVGIFSGLGSWTIVGAGPAVVVVMEEFNISLSATLDGLINWCILLIGIGVCHLMFLLMKNFIWVPLGLYFGTRPTFLAGCLLLFGTTIWCAASYNWTSLVAARIVGGFAISCGEALPATVVKDLFFLHERGWWMGIYMFFFQAAYLLGVIASGFLITSSGWRWHFWVSPELKGINCSWWPFVSVST